MRTGTIIGACIVLIAFAATFSAQTRPSIIFIQADDLGYGDLSCYGQRKFRTPNIDRLAAEGMRFTQYYAGSTVCAPSRSALMTGQHTGHTRIRGNARHPLLPEDVTVAEALKSAAYKTALIGKWGLGEAGTTGVPNRQGFDYFFGYLNQRHAHNYYPTFLWRNEKRIDLRNLVPDEDAEGSGVSTNRLRAGEVHALVGENGAGKSTLIKIITGALEPDWPDSGSISINGRQVIENSPSLAKRLGVAAIYQQPALFPDLSVAENLALGLERGGLWRGVNWRERNARASELLGRIGARIDPQTPAGALTMPERQLVEIARALGASPEASSEAGAKILIMDEPTASLTDRETERLFKVITELRAQGVGVIYISHRLEELFEIADRVTVLRDGETVATRAMKEVSRAELISLMVGRELSAVFPKREVKIGETILEIRNLSSRSAGIHNVNPVVGVMERDEATQQKIIEMGLG